MNNSFRYRKSACALAGAVSFLLIGLLPCAHAGDWGGNFVDSVGLHAPARGEFHLLDAVGGPGVVHAFRYGPPGAGWQSVAGDWDGDGIDTIRLYDPATSSFFLRDSNSEGPPDAAFAAGPAGLGWQALAGDWDGDGVDTVALYDPAHSVFHLTNDHAGATSEIAFLYGPVGLGWIPLAGDWDGDGVDTVGLYDPVASAFHLSNSRTGGFADFSFLYGPAGFGWIPLAGDWNGDGIDTVGLYDPVSSVFHLKNSHSGGWADNSILFGPAGLGWVPVGTPPQPVGGSDSEQLRLLQLVNAARAQGHDCGSEGLFEPAAPLTWNDLLAAAAQRHSNDMAQRDFFSHTGSDGTDVADRVTASGYDWWTVGENIAGGYDRVEAVNAAWLASPGHCASIMNPNFEEFGSAIAENPDSDYRIYWTQVFGTAW